MASVGAGQLRAFRALSASALQTVAFVDQYEWLLVSLISTIFALTNVLAAFRPLWFDELFTFYIARLPDIHSLYRAIPGDGNPPLYYLMARLSMGLFGPTAFAVRLPSMLAFIGATIAVYCFVRRRRGAIFGLFAMLALASSGMAIYASEARPYALMLGFLGLTVVSWQSAAEKKRGRVVPLLGVTVGIAGALAAHHYGIFQVGIPLIFGEVARSAKRRRLDLPMYCAGFAGLLILFVTLPFASATHQVMLNYVKDSTTFWAKPTIRSLASYREMISAWLPVAFLVLLTSANTQNPESDSVSAEGECRSIPSYEVVAAVSLSLLVPIMVCLTLLATGYYVSRYAIGAAMGIAMLLGFMAPVIGPNRRNATAVTALCVMLLGLHLSSRAAAASFRAIKENGKKSSLARITGDLNLADAPGEEPIVFASALAYMPAWFYAAPQLRERLHYLGDLPFAVRQPDFLPELSLTVNQPYVPSKIDDYRHFLDGHKHFLLYSVGAPNLEWTLQRLLSDGWSLRLLQTTGDAKLYAAEAPILQSLGGKPWKDMRTEQVLPKS